MSETKKLPFAIPKEELAQFCQRHHICKLSLFGSVLRDDFTPESDVDFLVEFEPGKTPGFFKIVSMEMELSELLEGRKIDLRTPNELSIYFRDRVMEEAVVQYDSNECSEAFGERRVMKNLSEFRETTLGGITRKDRHGLVDGPFGSNLPASEYTSSGIPVIRGSNLSLGQERFRAKDYVFVSEETANRLSRSLCHPDDIIFTKKGTLGQTGIVPRTETYKIFLLSSNQMKLSVDTEIADPLFVYYYVSSPISRERILREAMTTGVPKINLEYLRKFSILLPPLSTQRKIAAILSAYDDLIENNTRRIEILEEMARSLYREWFDNFRFPGHEQVKMVDSELGLIPEGWEVGRLDDALFLQRGFDITKKQFKPGLYDVISSSGFTGTHNECKVKAPGVVIGRKGTLNSVFFAHKDFWPTDTTLWVKEFRRATPLYAFYLLSDLKLEKYDCGAACPTLNRNDIHGLPVILPPQKTLGQFNHFVEPLLVLKNNLLKRNDNLRQTRDLLLPRLISGEIDVENLDINTGEIAA